MLCNQACLWGGWQMASLYHCPSSPLAYYFNITFPKLFYTRVQIWLGLLVRCIFASGTQETRQGGLALDMVLVAASWMLSFLTLPGFPQQAESLLWLWMLSLEPQYGACFASIQAILEVPNSLYQVSCWLKWQQWLRYLQLSLTEAQLLGYS